jgi:uncharacterized repeat protein (TIGR02543 family)
MKLKKVLSLFLSMILIFTAMPSSALADNETQDPLLTKTAEWIDPASGLAKITLTATGTPIDQTQDPGADILLVLDASGSMSDYPECGGDLELKRGWWNSYYECSVCHATYSRHEVPNDNKCDAPVTKDGTRWEIALDAVDELIAQVIPDNTSRNRMGIVLFSADSDGSSSQNNVGSHENAILDSTDFTNLKSKITDACVVDPTGGTDYTGALQKAKEMITERTDQSRPVHLIFLTDGAPGGWHDGRGNEYNKIHSADWNGSNEIGALKNMDDVTIYTVGFVLSDSEGLSLLRDYATDSSKFHNISDGDELSNLFHDLGGTISSGVTVLDTVDTQYFTLANKPETDVSYVASAGSVDITNGNQFVWRLDDFSTSGATLEIYIQLKSEYINQAGSFPTNVEGSAGGNYYNEDGNSVGLPVNTDHPSSPMPTLERNTQEAAVHFHFIGTDPQRAAFDTTSQANQIVTIGENVVEPSVSVEEGYQITDWYENENCTGSAFDFTTAVSSNQTINLYAKVERNAEATYAYTVNFYKNGTKAETVPANVWAGSPNVTLADVKDLKTNNYENYTFTEAKVGQTTYATDTDEIAIAPDGTTAVEVYYTSGMVELTFQRGDRGTFSAVADQEKESITKSHRYDTSFDDAPSVTAEYGWKTVGWYVEGDSTQTIVTFPQTITEAKTYVMKYEKNNANWKKVTFYKNDGTATEPQVVDDILSGTTIAPADWPTQPERYGYIFKGWFTADGTDGNWGSPFAQSSIVNENMEIFAKWETAKTDVSVAYYLGSLDGKELTFSESQKISNAVIDRSYTDYINDALKEKGATATNLDVNSNYYELSKTGARIYINGALLESQKVAEGDQIQVVYSAKNGRFRVWEFLENNGDGTPGQYLDGYEASLPHGSNLKYGSEQIDLTVEEINKVLTKSLNATKLDHPGAKLKSVYIDYEMFSESEVKEWQSPVLAVLNPEGTAVQRFPGLEELTIHGDCETRLTFNYELPMEVRVEYHKQYGDTDKYYQVADTDYVVGGNTNYVYKRDTIEIADTAESLNTIQKVVPSGIEGYEVAYLATAEAPTVPITDNAYLITKPVTFIVYLDAITANEGEIVNIDPTGAPLEGAEFTIDQSTIVADSTNKNEYPIAQDFVYGVEYAVSQVKSAAGYEKVDDFKVKLKADGTGLEVVGTVDNVSVNGMTITVTNAIDSEQKFAYTVNRFVKGTETPVRGFSEGDIHGEASLGNFTWSNLDKTTTGYKLVTNPVQPTSMQISSDATKNVETVYYEIDDTQTRSYKVTYWKEGESQPFDTVDDLTVLEANKKVAYDSISMENIPDGYELKEVRFGGKPFVPDQNVVITSLENEIKVTYQKKAGMWFDVTFLAGAHGTLNDNLSSVQWQQVLKGTLAESFGGIPKPQANDQYEFVGWSADGGNTIIQEADMPVEITQSVTYVAQWAEIYNMQYFVFEKKNKNDNTITAKYDTEAEAAAAIAAHMPHPPAHYSSKFYENQSGISEVDLAKFEVSTKPDTKDRTETATAKFADLIRNYPDTETLTEAYGKVPGYDVVPFRLVLTGNIVHVDCYLVKNEEQWTTITFSPGEYGQWADGTTEAVVIDAVKGTPWSEYSDLVPEKPVQNAVGWKLSDETQIWNTALPSADSLIPDSDVVYTAVWTEDVADIAFQIEGVQVDGTEQLFGVVKPENRSIQKGKTVTDPTAMATATMEPGYLFDGWYTDEGYTNKFDFANTISEDTTLYGKVVINDEAWASVTFKAGENGMLHEDGEDVDTVVTDPILIGNTIGRTIPTANPNTGYEFGAWYKVTEEESGTIETPETPTPNTVVTKELEYLAKFEKLMKVTFQVNTSKAVADTENLYERTGISKGAPWSSIEVPEIQGKTTPEAYSHDYEFVGWSGEFPATVTSDLAFVAEFDDIYTFVVEHADLNGGVYPNESLKESPHYYKNKAGDAIHSEANEPLRGYPLTNITVYVGEEKQEVSTTGELIQTLKDRYNLTLTEDGTLSGAMPENCIWIKYGYQKLTERTVAYVSEGRTTNMPENITDRYVGDEIVVATEQPHRDGFDFGGWEVLNDTVTVEDGRFIMPDSDVTLKAVWTPNEEVWNYKVEHYLEGATSPFSTTTNSVLKREPIVEAIVLNAPQGYKFKEYQFNGDMLELPFEIDSDEYVIRVVYETNALIVKHVYGSNTVYDKNQSKANVEDDSVIVNAVSSGRYTRIRSVTVNGIPVAASSRITLKFEEGYKCEVVFTYYKKKSNNDDDTSGGGGSNGNDSDFGEIVTILDEEVPLADGLDMVNHFAYVFGYEDETVRPLNQISREEVAAIFYRLLNDPVRESLKTTEHDFPDVLGQRWSNKSIATLANGEIIAGYPDGQFKPAHAITRAEFAVIVAKFDSLSETENNMFTDIENHWAKDFINSAAQKGWINGYPDGTFHPDAYITRAEAMTLINSVLNRKVSKEGLLEDATYWSDNPEDAWYYEAVMEATNSHDFVRETPESPETWTTMTADKVLD